MKQLPILFSTEMVQALLAGRKTADRRIVKNEHAMGLLESCLPEYVASLDFCPYGKPGDVLYVRETLHQNGELGLSYAADNENIDEAIIPDSHLPYRNYAHCNIPKIHMPKWAARTWLEVEAIEVQRLQDISEEDARAEGIECNDVQTPGGDDYADYYRNYLGSQKEEDWPWIEGKPVESFKSLWLKINGVGSWEANPWVWVIRFKVLSTTGKPDNI